MSARFNASDDYSPTWPNLRPELETLLESARKVSECWNARDDHAYAGEYLQHAIDLLQTDLHHMFGDRLPPARRAVPAVVVPAAPPVHSPRRVLALAS